MTAKWIEQPPCNCDGGLEEISQGMIEHVSHFIYKTNMQWRLLMRASVILWSGLFCERKELLQPLCQSKERKEEKLVFTCKVSVQLMVSLLSEIIHGGLRIIDRADSHNVFGFLER
jgi:hypothetical protein